MKTEPSRFCEGLWDSFSSETLSRKIRNGLEGEELPGLPPCKQQRISFGGWIIWSDESERTLPWITVIVTPVFYHHFLSEESGPE